MKIGFSLGCGVVGFVLASVSAQAQCFDDRQAWVGAVGVPTLSEGFSGYTSDTSFDPGPLATHVGQLRTHGGSGVRNFVDTPPFAFPEHNGTSHASCYVNHAETGNVGTLISIDLAGSPRAFGCDVYNGLGGEGVEMLVFTSSATTPLMICPLASDGAPQFIGVGLPSAAGGGIERIAFRAVDLISGSDGEAFGIDDIGIVTRAQCFDDRTQWAIAAGATNLPSTSAENFQSFLVDTPFNVNPVTLQIGEIQSFQGVNARNFIDVPPFTSNANNGTNHAACYVNHADPMTPETRIEIRLRAPATAFGAQFFLGAGSEGVRCTYYKGGLAVHSCVLQPVAASLFLGVVTPDPIDRVVLEAATLTPGLAGQFFGLDNIQVVECPPIGGPSAVLCPAQPNSTGEIGRIHACGSTSLGDNNVTLIASQLPPGQFGYFLTSLTPGLFMPPGSNGFVCLGGDIGRYQNDVGQGPCFSTRIDLLRMPVNPPEPALTGQRWRFQCWYRDLSPIGNTSNFTDVVVVQFTP